MPARRHQRRIAHHLVGKKPFVKSALTVAFHDRSDMIVATAVLGNNDPALQHDVVLDFLNSDPALRWAEITLGL